jgi:hypothetical protein
VAEQILSQRPCEVCHNTFTPSRSWNKFCRKSCQWRHHDQRKRSKRPKRVTIGTDGVPFGTLTCKTCEKSFISTRSSKKYCSHKCYRLRMSRNWISKNRKRGLCYSCSRKPVSNTSSWCEQHWFTQAAWRSGLRGKGSWKRIRELLEHQNYICPYTGKVLIIGVNASVDHKLPRSRYPELVGDISNYEWVDEDVNRAKRSMTRDEFVLLCKIIARRFK